MRMSVNDASIATIHPYYQLHHPSFIPACILDDDAADGVVDGGGGVSGIWSSRMGSWSSRMGKLGRKFRKGKLPKRETQ